MKLGKLPETNSIQFYHPPLHHMISAGWLNLNDFIGIDFNMNLEGLQVLTAIYSSLIMLVVYAILKKIDMKDLYKILIISMIAFHPTFIFLAGSINNDILMILLTFLVILYLIKWEENTNIKNTIIMAIFTGCSVMAKVSAAIIAIPMIFIFLKKLIEQFKKSNKEGFCTILLLVIFGVISLPIGLWHPIRNKILFDQPLGGVLIPSQAYYIGHYSDIARFFTVSVKELLTTFCSIPGDYNVPAFIIKSSLFGEWHFENIMLVAGILKFLNLLLILISIVFSLMYIIKHKDTKNKTLSNILLIYYFVLMISYLIFNINYPYTCTMDFRYLVPTTFIGIYFLALELEALNKKNSKFTEIVEYLIIIFYVLSISMFFII